MPDIWNSIPVERYLTWILSAVRILFILAGGYVLTIVLTHLLSGFRKYAVALMIRRGDALDTELEKRATTIVNVVRRPLLVVVWAAVILTVLREMNIEILPLLAGLGLGFGALGVAVGLGAQSLIKDIIGGLFLLMENQIRVNDVVVVNGTGGLVEEMNLRTTVLRSENGAVHIIPNGSIQTLSNMTREYSYYVFELGIAYDQDPDRALEVLQEIARELRSDPVYGPAILDDLDIMGVDRFGDWSVTIKARIKTLPVRQWSVGREMNRRLRTRFRAENIQIPYPTRTVRLEEPVAVGMTKDDIKGVVRETLEEISGRGKG